MEIEWRKIQQQKKVAVLLVFLLYNPRQCYIKNQILTNLKK